MADSDDEYDRKRRDKFRGERSSGGDNYRSERRNDDRSRGREDWQDRGRGRPDYRDYRRERFSPERGGPPMKRMRNEWGEDGRPRYGHDGYLSYGGVIGAGGGAPWGHDHYGMHGAHGFGGVPPAAHPARGGGGGAVPDPANQLNPELQTQPPMLTLKQFLATQDDSISDSDAITKYNDYKQDFKRQQLNEFFVTHKDEEWFKIKYHPEESGKRKEEQNGFLKKRAEVFTELLNTNIVGNISVDTTQTDQLLRLLDTAVIKLEGGTEDDLKVLDEKPVEIKTFETSAAVAVKTVAVTQSAARINPADEDWSDMPPSKVDKLAASRKKSAAANDDGDWDEDDDEKPVQPKNTKNPFARNKVETKKTVDNDDWSDIPAKLKATKKVNDDDDDGDNWDDDDTGEYATKITIKEPTKIDKDVKQKDDDASDNEDKTDTPTETKIVNKDADDDDDDGGGGGTPEPKLKEKKKRRRSNSSSSSSSSSDSDDEDQQSKVVSKQQSDVEKGTEDKSAELNDSTESTTTTPAAVVNEQIATTENQSLQVEKEQNVKDASPSIENDGNKGNGENIENGKEEKPKIIDSAAATVAANDDDEDGEEKVETIDLDKVKDDEPKPRALHKTSSIFLRNLAPTITKSEVESMCKRYSGFLRVAIADPLVERRWFRRGWVTFQRDVNIKEICWNLNNIRLRDCELGAIVNRDLSRRVRPINGITAHKTIVRSDIKLCAKIAYNLDVKAGLWQNDTEIKSENGGEKPTFGLNSNNPVLQNITDYLIEEASAEEDELLGLSTGDNKDSEGELLERDPELLLVLDKLILYMRIVHSVDFYNHCEYPYEDEMPNRLGIIHARGPAPQNKVTPTEIQDYTRNFETKMSSFLTKSQPIDENELKKFGCKDIDAEVEKFVQANTQELAKDKWLCPLSGKKFKGPDFIRKHIFNKHAEKVDEVKKEVEYFNNYLKDPKRPQLPEHPGNNRKPPAEVQQPPGYRPGYMAPMYGAPYAGYAPPMVIPPRPRGGGFGGRRGGGNEYRPIIHYRDLDAPREPDDFL